LSLYFWGLWQFKEDLGSIQIAYTTSVAIEFAEPGPYDNNIQHLEKSILINLVNLAMNFCLNNSESDKNFSNKKHDFFYKLFSLMANQFSMSYNSYEDYGRALLLYKIIPNEIEAKKPKYSLPCEFEKR